MSANPGRPSDNAARTTASSSGTPRAASSRPRSIGRTAAKRTTTQRERTVGSSRCGRADTRITSVGPGGLLERLQERVLGLLVHPVGRVDEEHPTRGAPSGARREVRQLANLLDRDHALPLCVALVLAGVVGARTAWQAGDEQRVGVVAGLEQPTVLARPAGWLGARTQQRRRQSVGDRRLPDRLGTLEQQGVREPPARSRRRSSSIAPS